MTTATKPTTHIHEHDHGEQHVETGRRAALVASMEASRADLAQDLPALDQAIEKTRQAFEKQEKVLKQLADAYREALGTHSARCLRADKIVDDAAAELRATAPEALDDARRWLNEQFQSARSRPGNYPDGLLDKIRDALRGVQELELSPLDAPAIEEQARAIVDAIATAKGGAR